MKRVQVGEEVITLEPFSGRKAVRVIRTVEQITRGVPDILDRWAEFNREYEATHVTELDRAAARRYYPPQVLTEQEPLVDSNGEVMLNSVGEPFVRNIPKLDANGQAVLGPDPLGHMTDADWEASGNKLRLARAPSQEESIAAVFPMALDLAENQVLRLLALLATSNTQLKRHAREGSLDEYLDERADELIDAPATDLLELAVASGEMVDEQFRSKIKQLGERVPNAMRLFGLEPKSRKEKEADSTSKKQSSETSPPSSTDSPSSIDGTNEPPSIEPVGRPFAPSASG